MVLAETVTPNLAGSTWIRFCPDRKFSVAMRMGCQDPEPTILVAQSWPGMSSLQNQQLLTET
jgi:hypothetical protein